MARIILLNGPRNAGKDFIADRFIENADSARKLPIMWPFKLKAMAEYGISPSFVQSFEFFKDAPIDAHKIATALGNPKALEKASELQGKTPRQVYIKYGEKLRGEKGKRVIAETWARHAKQYAGYKYLLVPDVRFQPEVDEAVRMFKMTKVMLVRVCRQGHDWTDDIGSYLSHTVSVDFNNDVDASVSCPGMRLHELAKDALL